MGNRNNVINQEDIPEAEKVFLSVGADSPHPNVDPLKPEASEMYEMPDSLHGHMMWYGMIPLNLLGLVLNSLVFWLWMQETSFRVTIALFKALAVADNCFLFFFLIYFLLSNGSTEASVFRGLALASEHVLVNITLILVVCRCVQVRQQSESKTILSKVRLRLALTVIVAVCVVLKVMESLVVSLSSNAVGRLAVRHIEAHLLMTFPLFLLLLASGWLALHLCANAVAPRMEQPLPAVFPTPESHQARTQARQRNLTAAVLSFGVLTLLTYPFITTVRLLLLPQTSEISKHFMPTFIHILRVFNSSSKFFIYLAFLSRFRSILMAKVITTYAGSYAPPAPEARSSSAGFSFATRPSMESSMDHNAGSFSLYKRVSGEWVVRERPCEAVAKTSKSSMHGPAFQFSGGRELYKLDEEEQDSDSPQPGTARTKPTTFLHP